MKISVIMASYNYAQYLEEAIDSVINQSYKDWELIIVDDGSSDNSVEIIKKYCQKDSRIKLLQHLDNQNKGLKETILMGIENATGEWVAFLESDDFWRVNNLFEKVKIIEKYPEVKLIFNRVDFIANDKNNKRRARNFEKTQKKLAKMTFPKNMFYDFYINNMILTFSCAMVEKETFKKTNFGSYSDKLLDWWIWIHIAHENKFYFINESLTKWRLHSQSYIKAKEKFTFAPPQALAYKDIYDNYEKSFKLLLFMIFSSIKLAFVRLIRILRRTGGRIIHPNDY